MTKPGSDGQNQIHTQTPSRVSKEVVLATKILRETWFRWAESNTHQSCPEGSRVGDENLARDLVRGRIRYTPRRVLKEVVLVRKPLGETGIGWAESDTHPVVS